jgi:hypothetical protein
MAACYGIDLSNGINSLQALEALNQCFFEAHKEDTGLTMNTLEETAVVKNYCNFTVKKAFEETQGDYNNPTKESILRVVDYLAKFSATFRNPNIIEKHKNEILQVCQAIK